MDDRLAAWLSLATVIAAGIVTGEQVGEATPVLFGGATTQQGLRACGLTHRLTIETTLDAVVRFPVEQGGISGRTTTFG